MTILDAIPFEIDEIALCRELHVPEGGSDEARLIDLAREVLTLARPRALYETRFVESLDQGRVTVEGVTFVSKVLEDQLAEVGKVFLPFVATCGHELDALEPPADDVLIRFWLDHLREKALSAAVGHLMHRIAKENAFEKLASMSPGSGAAGIWELTEQRPLFDLLGDTESLVGVRLTGSCLMVPAKSVSGLAYPSEKGFASCQACNRENCPKRRAAFDPALMDRIHGLMGEDGTKTLGPEP